MTSACSRWSHPLNATISNWNGGTVEVYVAADPPVGHYAVTHCGRICYKSRKINLSQVFAGQNVGVKQVSDLWLVTFMDYDLGYFDDVQAGADC